MTENEKKTAIWKNLRKETRKYSCSEFSPSSHKSKKVSRASEQIKDLVHHQDVPNKQSQEKKTYYMEVKDYRKLEQNNFEITTPPLFFSAVEHEEEYSKINIQESLFEEKNIEEIEVFTKFGGDSQQNSMFISIVSNSIIDKNTKIKLLQDNVHQLKQEYKNLCAFIYKEEKRFSELFELMIKLIVSYERQEAQRGENYSQITPSFASNQSHHFNETLMELEDAIKESRRGKQNQHDIRFSFNAQGDFGIPILKKTRSDKQREGFISSPVKRMHSKESSRKALENSTRNNQIISLQKQNAELKLMIEELNQKNFDLEQKIAQMDLEIKIQVQKVEQSLRDQKLKSQKIYNEEIKNFQEKIFKLSEQLNQKQKQLHDKQKQFQQKSIELQNYQTLVEIRAKEIEQQKLWKNSYQMTRKESIVLHSGQKSSEKSRQCSQDKLFSQKKQKKLGEDLKNIKTLSSQMNSFNYASTKAQTSGIMRNYNEQAQDQVLQSYYEECPQIQEKNSQKTLNFLYTPRSNSKEQSSFASQLSPKVVLQKSFKKPNHLTEIANRTKNAIKDVNIWSDRDPVSASPRLQTQISTRPSLQRVSSMKQILGDPRIHSIGQKLQRLRKQIKKQIKNYGN